MNRSGGNFAPVVGATDTMTMNTPNQNGRIDLLSPLPSLDIPSYQTRSVNNANYTVEATYGQIVPNELSSIYFSEKNIDALQQGIRYRVYKETNGQHIIGRQSDQELKIVMRSIYYQYAKHQNGDLIGQVRELNSKVLDWVVPEVLSNLKQYEVYRKDASMLPMPMERAPLITTKGTKVLEIKSFL